MIEFIVPGFQRNYDGFQVAIMKKRTMARARGYIEKCHEIWSRILGPDSSQVLLYKGYLLNPSSHRNYLILD